MIQFLIFLSYYQTELETPNDDYYGSFKFLEFGYIENAKYTINIKSPEYQMIFGLATKEELKNIEQKRYKQKYCDGTYKLTDIQYLITTHFIHNDTIGSKSILTPFSISCNYSNSFTFSIDIENGDTHQDYRAQIAKLYTIFFMALFFNILIATDAYFFMKMSLGIDFYICYNIFLLTIIGESITSFLSYYLLHDYEFFINFYDSFVDKMFEINISSFILSFIGLIFVSLLNLLLYSNSPYRLSIFDSKFAIATYLFLLFIPLIIVLFFQMNQNNSAVLGSTTFMLFILLFYSISNKISFSVCAFAVYLFDKYVFYALKLPLIMNSSDSSSTNALWIYLDLFNIICQLISVVLLLVGIIRFHNFDKSSDNNNNNNIDRPGNHRLIVEDDEAEIMKQAEKETEREEDKNENENENEINLQTNYTFLYQ